MSFGLNFERQEREPHCFWLPLQLEPIIGSEERLTVAIIYSFGASTPKVAKIIDRKVGAIPIKENLETIDDLIDLVVDSVSGLSSLHDLEKWVPPIEGFQLGRIREAFAKNVDELLYQACYRSSFLSIGAALKADLDKGRAVESQRFVHYVEQHITERSPTFSMYFNRRVRVGKSKFETKVDFLNPKICAEFGVINPMGVAYGLTQLKAKMINLEAAKDFCEEEMPAKIEMIILRPDETVASVSKRNSGKISDTLSMLSDLAEKHEIGLVQVYSQYQGAEYLYQKAA